MVNIIITQIHRINLLILKRKQKTYLTLLVQQTNWSISYPFTGMLCSCDPHLRLKEWVDHHSVFICSAFINGMAAYDQRIITLTYHHIIDCIYCLLDHHSQLQHSTNVVSCAVSGGGGLIIEVTLLLLHSFVNSFIVSFAFELRWSSNGSPDLSR
jgi:hypothetical protein